MTDRSAVVHVVDGQAVLDDPDGTVRACALGKANCNILYSGSRDAIARFTRRVAELGIVPEEAVIVLLNVDDVNGRPIAEALMPGHDWTLQRTEGCRPCARGIAMRAGIVAAIDAFDVDAATKLREMAGVAVVVVDYGVAEVYPT